MLPYATDAVFEDPAPVVSPAPLAQVHTWFARVSAGVGPVPGSTEQDLFTAYGYTATRWWFAADGGWLVSDCLGIGGWIAGSYRSSSAADANGGPAPELNEVDTFVGPTAFLFLDQREVTVYVGVRGGLAFGTPGLGGLGKLMAAPAMGGEVGFRGGPVGLSVGYLFASGRVPGELGRSYDLGGAYFWVNAYVGR